MYKENDTRENSIASTNILIKGVLLFGAFFLFAFISIPFALGAACTEGDITAACQCGAVEASSGLCCDAGSEMVWFDPYYSELGGCPTGTYYYVDQNAIGAADTKAGTSPDQPWLTVKKATNTLQAGDVALVKTGNYYQTSTSWDRPAYNPVNSGTPDHRIVFRTYPGAEVNLTAYSAVVGSYRSDYIVFDGFRILEGLHGVNDDDGDGQSGFGGFPVSITGSTRLPPGEATSSQLTEGWVIMNNEVVGTDTPFLGGQDNYCGIWIDKGVQGAIVRNNIIHGWSGTMHNAAGIISYANWDSTFENNWIYDANTGIYIKGGPQGRNTYRYNLIENVSLGFEVGADGTAYDIYQNIVKNCGCAYHLWLGGPLYDSAFHNNLGYNCSTGQQVVSNIYNLLSFNNIFSGTTKAIQVEDPSFVPELNSDYNDFHSYSSFVLGWSSIGRLPAWQSTTGHDLHSLEVDPQFVSPGSDFHLQAGSPVRTLGMDLKDYDGDGNTAERIPAGPYITGNEVIGPDREGVMLLDPGTPDNPPPVEGDTCAEGEITSQCMCGVTNASSGLCCDAGSEMVWFDPYYKNLGGCPSGTYYYVDKNNPNADDHNAGTDPNQPWKHPARGFCGEYDEDCYGSEGATTALGPGDVMLVQQGTYYTPGGSWSRAALNPLNSGTAQDRIVFRTYPGAEVNLTAFAGGVGVGNIEDYIVIDGFRIFEGEQGIYYNENWGVDAFQAYPIVLNGGTMEDPDTVDPRLVIDGWVIMNTELIGTDSTFSPTTGQDNYCGVWMTKGVRGLIFRNNVVHGFSGTMHNAAGIVSYQNWDSIYEHNHFYDSYAGIYVKGGPQENNTYRYNLFEDVNLGFEVGTGVGNYSLYQNIVKNCRGHGTAYHVWLAGTTDNIDFHNNVGYNCYQGEEAVSNFYDFRSYNNIFSGSVFAIRVQDTSLLPEFKSDYNSFYNYSSFVLGDGGIGIGKLTAWQTQTGKDLHSMEGDPLFVDPGSDFHLQPNSPVRTLGMDLQDYDNDGDTTERIPAGAYITGSEVIGPDREGATVESPPPTIVKCSLLYDQDPCDCITTTELINAINGWYHNEVAISDVINHVSAWKDNSSC